jgi:murein L,D-transpeptidase YcbB/YkuD
MFWRTAVTAILLVLPGYAFAQTDVPPAVQVSAAAIGDNGLTSRFYQQRNYALAWTGRAAENDARQALTAMEHAADEGLDPERYRIVAGGDAVARDIALSAALLQYMRDLSLGRVELEGLDSDVALPARFFDAPVVLEQALREGRLSELLAGLAPGYPDYMLLKGALARYPDPAPRDTIIANMERWRWLPTALEPNRIVVNAADAQLQLWLGGKMVLTSRVIVGRPRSPTPILQAEGAGVTVNPSWTVPHSIAAKEILLKLKVNHAYLASQDMVLLDGPADDPYGLRINWRAVRVGTFPYRIRQFPGPRNPLGQIKIELPNRFDVYLHDTPGKSAFDRPARDVSHGCVRVEQILPLASYALAADLTAVGQIAEAIGQGETKYLPLFRKLPIYFLYWTAFAGPEGELQFRPDIYGRDQRLIAAMRPRPLRIAANYASCPKG